MSDRSAVPRVLVVDDDEDCARGVRSVLQDAIPGIHVDVAYNGWQAEHALREPSWSCLIVDLKLGWDDGVDLLTRARRLHPEAARILMTGQPTFPDAVKAVNSAAVSALLLKPIDAHKLARTVEAALRDSR